MNQETFSRIEREDLTPKQKKVLSLFLEGMTDEDIIAQIDATHRTTVINHLKNLCTKFGIVPEAYSNYRERLLELFMKYKPQVVSSTLLEKYGYITAKPSFPDKPEPLNSPYYVERTSIEERCYAILEEPGVLIRVKAPNQMGKTSLLKRIIARSKVNDYHTVYLNLSLIETEKLNNQHIFLRAFYAYFQQRFPSAPVLTEWDKDTPLMIQCTRQFQSLLQKLDKALVLVLDEVDRLFEYPTLYQNFFPMLRNWHEKANESETWEKLRLVVAHSTENYGKLDINQSPFNVGIPIQLEEFTLEQVQNLFYRHGLNREDAIPLMSIIGGHPYLVRLALYHLYHAQVTLQQLLKDAPTNAGIYKQHLIRHLEVLQVNQELGTVFKQVLSQLRPVIVEKRTIQVYQLESMGLIKLEGDSVKISCPLYQRYFRDRLN